MTMNPRLLRVAGAVALLLALLGAALVARNDAGLSGPWLLIALVAAVPLYLVGRGWRLPWWMHAVAAALPLSLLIVAAVHGYGDGAARATRFGYGALLALAVAGWATTTRRRLAVGVGVLALAADQYITGWFPWWGGQDPTKLMWGSFYWHNQFGTYLVIGIAVAAVLAVAGRRSFALLGFVVTFLAGAGVIGSGSRASVALLALVLVVAIAIGAAAHRWPGLIRGLVLPVGVVLTAVLMTSAAFFPTDADSGDGSGSATDRLVNGDSAESSVTERIKFWGDALRLGASAPLVGIGLQAYGRALQCVRDTSLTSHPHNEYLLAWAEGGIVAALPVFAALVGMVWLVVGALRRPLDVDTRRRIRFLPSGAELRDDPVRWGALLALVVAAGHAAFDFDWAYPALLAIVGIVGGIAAAPVFADRQRMPLPTALVNLALVAVLVAAAITGHLVDPVPGEALRPLVPGMYVCPD